MTRPPKPDDGNNRIRDIEARLAALEVGIQAGHTTIQHGLFRVRDIEGGDERVRIGDLNSLRNYGIELIDDNNIVRFRVDSDDSTFRVVDDLGAERVLIGQLDEDGTYGIRVVDDAELQIQGGGRLRVRADAESADRVIIGELEEDVYGIEVTDDGVIRLLHGGYLRVLDDDDNPRARLGALATEGNYGLILLDLAGQQLLAIDNDGWREPYFAHPWRDPLLFKSTVDTAFESVWMSTIGVITHKGLATTIGWRTDVDTTGEVRLRIAGGLGAGETVSVALGADASGTQVFQWLHGCDLHSGPITVEAQARVTGGPGEVHVYDPNAPLFMVNPAICTETGIP